MDRSYFEGPVDEGKGGEEEGSSVVSSEVEQEHGIGKWSAKNQQDSRYIDYESENEACVFLSSEKPLRVPNALRGAGSHLCVKQLNSAKPRVH